MNSIIVLGTKTKEGKTLKTLIVTAMVAALISVFGFVPSSVVFAEEDAATDGVAGIGDVQYASLQEAIDNAQDSDTITLLKDTAENAVINDEGMTLTIDLGGHKIAPADGKEPTIYVDNAKDVTIKNGEVTGNNTDDRYVGAFHILSKTATIDNVDFHDNRACLTAFFAATMVDGNDFQDRNITITNCKFHDSGARDGEKAYPAVCVNGYSTKIDNCSFYKNDRSLELYSQTPNNDVEVNYSIRNTRFSNNSGQTIDAGVPAGGGMDMYNVYINDNKLSGGDDAVAYFHGVGTGNSEGASTTMNWCKIYGNSGAKHTILTDTPGSLSMYGCTIEENTAEETGAICAMQGYVIMNQYAVIRNNSATGSSETTCGGITLLSYIGQTYVGTPGEDGHYETSGDPASIRVYGGALYGNRSENAEYKATDLYVGPKAYSVANVTPEQFAGHATWNPIDRDMTDHKWIEQVSNTEEDELTMYSKKARVYTVDKGDEEAKAARAAQKASKCVYIDGVKGSDEGDGTRENPVKTFAKAKEILESKEGANVIYILNQVTVGENEKWSLPEGARIERDKEFKGNCIFVPKGAKLTLEDIVVDGGTKEGAVGDNPMIKVSGELEVRDGAEIRNNESVVVEISSGAVFNMTGGTIKDTKVPNKYDSAPVVVKPDATFNMSGGVIENNVSVRGSTTDLDGQGTLQTTTTYSSGGIYVDRRGTVNISGDAVLRNNRANMGAAIYMDYNSEVNISGGKFIGNKADKMGGAIVVATNAAKGLTITGGLFEKNTSSDTGGAIWSWGDKTYIYGGKFVDNTAGRYGGAIAIAEDPAAFIHMKNAIIRNNSASRIGGGIWVCPTGSIMFDAKEGVAMYDNTADVAGDDFASVPASYSRAFNVYLSETILAGERAAYYADGAVLQGGPYGATSSNAPRFDPENPGEKLLVYGQTRSGLAIKSIVSDPAKARLDKMAEEAEEGSVVLFEGNKAWMGGAIGGNSNVTNTEEFDYVELRITKSWAEDIAEEDIPDEITVNLLLDNEVIDTLTIKKEDGWEGKFRGLNREYLVEGRYSIEEVAIEGFVAIYSDITGALAENSESTENAENAESADDAEQAEDLSHVWIASIENSREPEVKEEIEPPETPEEGEVKGAVEEPEETATGEVKGDIENPTRSGSRTGDNVKLGAIIALLVAAAAACVVIFARRRRG